MTDNTTLTSILFAHRYSFHSKSRLVVVCVAHALNLTAMEDELWKALESAANEPFNLKHRAVYIGLALQIQDSREMAVDAGSDGKRSTSNRRQVILVLESL